DREAVLAERIEAARSDAETISSLETQVAELERRRFRLRRRPSSQPSSTASRSRYRSVSQFMSWLRRPLSGAWGYIATYWALLRSGSFDADTYLGLYHDVRENGINPL